MISRDRGQRRGGLVGPAPIPLARFAADQECLSAITAWQGWLTAERPILSKTVQTAANLDSVDKVSIGHAIVSRAIFVGLDQVIREYLAVLADA